MFTYYPSTEKRPHTERRFTVGTKIVVWHKEEKGRIVSLANHCKGPIPPYLREHMPLYGFRVKQLKHLQ